MRWFKDSAPTVDYFAIFRLLLTMPDGSTIEQDSRQWVRDPLTDLPIYRMDVLNSYLGCPRIYLRKDGQWYRDLAVSARILEERIEEVLRET